jgi:hypothetical protein
MAKNNNGNVKRQGRRVMPALRSGVRARATANKALTLGDLIAAAFDAAGGKVDDVAKVLGSSEIAAATGRKIVLV